MTKAEPFRIIAYRFHLGIKLIHEMPGGLRAFQHIDKVEDDITVLALCLMSDRELIAHILP